jgi:E3 ubiquitin-protein ligase makorin
LKECKYFNKGVGECPFGNKCFYKHADKDGRY